MTKISGVKSGIDREQKLCYGKATYAVFCSLSRTRLHPGLNCAPPFPYVSNSQEKQWLAIKKKNH